MWWARGAHSCWTVLSKSLRDKQRKGWKKTARKTLRIDGSYAHEKGGQPFHVLPIDGYSPTSAITRSTNVFGLFSRLFARLVFPHIFPNQTWGRPAVCAYPIACVTHPFRLEEDWDSSYVPLCRSVSSALCRP